jgi:hypothetical protein
MAQDRFQEYLENPVDNLFSQATRGKSSQVHELKDPGDTRAIRSWKDRDYDASSDGGGWWNPINAAAQAAHAQHELWGGLF